MMQKITRTFKKMKPVSKRSLAMLIFFVMLLTAIGSGSVLTAIAEEWGLPAVLQSATADEPADDDADADDDVILNRDKEDLADTGWNSSTDRLHIRIGNTWYDKYFSSGGETTFTVANDNTTIEFELNFNGTLYKLHSSQSGFSAAGIHSTGGEQRTAKSDYTSTYTVTGVYADTYTVTLMSTLNNGEVSFKINGTYDAGGGGGGETGGTATKVTNADLIDVLQGDKIMFYYAHEFSKTSAYLKDNTNSHNDVTHSDSLFTLFKKCKAAVACEPSATYWVSDNSGWAGRSIGTVAAGYMYCVYSSEDNPGYHSTNHLDDNTATTISWGTSSSTVDIGATSSTLSATVSGSTPYAATTTPTYYYTTDGEDFYEFDPTDLPELSPGTYTVKVAANDGKITIVSDTDGTLTVRDKTADSVTLMADKYTLTDVGETVTFTATATSPRQNNLTYKLYDSTNTQLDTQTTTNGGAVTFAAQVPNAQTKTYYATVEYTTTPANYTIINSDNVVITNSNDAYKPNYTVTIQVDDGDKTYGTVSAKSTYNNGSATTSSSVISASVTVKEGYSVTITATPAAGCQFKSWPTHTGLDTPPTSTSFTVSVYGDITVKADFALAGYQIISDGYTPNGNNMKKFRELPNGTLISVDSYTNGYYFKIYRNEDGYIGKTTAQGGYNITHYGNYYADRPAGYEAPVAWNNDANHDWYSDYSFQNGTGGSGYIVFDPSTDRVWISKTDSDNPTTRITAKDGTIRNYDVSNTYYTSDFGDTTITREGGSTTGVSNEYQFTSKKGTNAYHAQELTLTEAEVNAGETLTIRTTVTAAKTAEGYYVKGFVVSGYEESFSLVWQEFNNDGSEKDSYDDRAKIHGTDNSDQAWNEFTLTIKDYPASYIEITPIYFKRENKSGDNVRFYVDSFAGDVREAWGDTIAVDVYGEDNNRPYGGYPGQPMINYNGRYMIDIPRAGIQGITMNNYVFDDAHYNLFYGSDQTNKNRQTYDYNDFIYIQKKLDKLGLDEDIIFSFRYRHDESHKAKDTSQLADVVYYIDSVTDHSGEATDYRTNYNTMTAAHEAIYDFEPLTDFYGNRVDVFGDPVDTESNATKAAYNPLRIVSNGYDLNKAGIFGTAWALYQPDSWTGTADTYTLADVIGGQGRTDQSFQSESFLIDPDSEARVRFKYDGSIRDDNTPASSKYEDAVGNETILAYWQRKFQEQNNGSTSYPAPIADLVGVPVDITYEFEVQSGHSNQSIDSLGGDGNIGWRSDGRWYYSTVTKVKAHVVVEYAEKQDGTYVRDYFQGNNVDFTQGGYDPSANTGFATGVKAYFANSGTETRENITFSNTAKYTEANGITDGEYTFDLRTEGDSDGNYTFEGWYLLVNGEYTLITHDEEYDSEATNNDTYVARYYKTPSGNLTVTHTLDESSTGSATCTAQVEILNNSDTVIDNTTYPETASSIKIGPSYIKSNSTNKIRITLRQTPDQFSSYNTFEERVQGTLNNLTAGNNNQLGLTATVSIDTSAATKVATITFPISALFDASGNQTTKAAPFYSVADLNAYNYKLIYNYPAYVTSNGTFGYEVNNTFTADELNSYMTFSSGNLTFKDDTKKATFLSNKAPYEKNRRCPITWNYAAGVETYASNTLQVVVSDNSVTNNMVNVYVDFPYATTDGYANHFDAVPTDGNVVLRDIETKNINNEAIDASVTEPQHLEWLSFSNCRKDGDAGTPIYLTAPVLVKNGDNQDCLFRYWSVKNADGVEYTRCYYYQFNLALYQDCTIEPIYTVKVNGDVYNPTSYNDYGKYDGVEQQKRIEASASAQNIEINFIENSRNQYNASHSGNLSSNNKRNVSGDRIYTDFLISFNNVAKNEDGTPVKLRRTDADTAYGGIVINAVQTLTPTEDGYDTDLSHYVLATELTDSEKTSITGFVKGGALSGYAKSEFDTSGLVDNKNSIQYYYSIANKKDNSETVTANKTKLFRAVAYLKFNGTVYLSKPLYFTIYDIASITSSN